MFTNVVSALADVVATKLGTNVVHEMADVVATKRGIILSFSFFFLSFSISISYKNQKNEFKNLKFLSDRYWT